MSDYISREAAIAYIREQSEEMSKAFEELGGESGIYADAYNDLAEDFHRIPAADVAPVVHGHFVHDGPRFAGGVDWWHCSNCGRLASGSETRFDYCPKCGARMEGGDDGETD